MDSLILVMGAIAVVVLHIIAGILHRQQNRIQQRFALLEERLAGLESVTRPPTSPISNKVSGDTSLDRPAVAEVLKIPLTTPSDLGLDRSIITTTPNRNTVILPLAASHPSHAPFVPFGPGLAQYLLLKPKVTSLCFWVLSRTAKIISQ